jgi:hypothetical protein
MAIFAPSITWPSELFENGPDEDKRILLVGTATVGGSSFAVSALRVRPGWRGPDYRLDVSREIYDSLDIFLDDVEDLAQSAEVSTVEIDKHPYVLWMIPTITD